MVASLPVDIANEIRLLRQVHQGAFLIVEGRDDRLFMERFTCLEKCKIKVARGKENVRQVLEILNEDRFPGAVGLIDADFDRIEVPQTGSPNLVMPEYHDLETMLICSPALGRVLIELGSQSKLDNFDEPVLDAILRRGLPLGCLRLHSKRAKLDLRFDDLNYNDWIDRSTFQWSTSRLVEVVKNHSQRQDLSSVELESAIEELLDDQYNPRELCNGTDLVEILSIGLRGKLGNEDRSTANANALRRSLRLAYSEQDFSSSKLEASIRTWETLAVGFQVLRR